MKNKLVSNISYAALLAGMTFSPAAFANTMEQQASKTPSAIVQRVYSPEELKQKQELETALEEAQDQLPNIVEEKTHEATSYFKKGLSYLGKGISYPIKGIGKALGWTGEKTVGQVPVIGGTLSLPFHAADSGLGATGDIVETTMDVTGDMIKTGADSLATMTRSPSEAGRNFTGSLVKNLAHIGSTTAEVTGQIGSGVSRVPLFDMAGRGLGAALYSGGQLADISLRGQEKALYSEEMDETAGKQLLHSIGRFKADNERLVTPETIKAFESGNTEQMGKHLQRTIQENGSKMIQNFNTMTDNIKASAEQANETAKKITLKERLNAAQEAQQKLDDFNKPKTQPDVTAQIVNAAKAQRQ